MLVFWLVQQQSHYVMYTMVTLLYFDLLHTTLAVQKQLDIKLLFEGGNNTDCFLKLKRSQLR